MTFRPEALRPHLAAGLPLMNGMYFLALRQLKCLYRKTMSPSPDNPLLWRIAAYWIAWLTTADLMLSSPVVE
jgi:hypothetical protein